MMTYTRSRFSRIAIAATLAGGSLGALGMALWTTPAAAQFTVFDPTNYSQNLLTAARSLQQINNQIQSLQNQATMIVNQAKNLSRIDFPELQQLNQTLTQIDRLMSQAQAINFNTGSLEAEYQRLFPRSTNSSAMVTNAQAQLDASTAAFRQTMTVQAQVATNVQTDAATLSTLVGKSQGAEGSLQAQQATNQLLALVAKQQLQIQNLMAAQYRVDALEASRRAQAEADGRAATTRFLGTGQAYHPQ
jgi:type IV secretion system protein TrbJ